MIPAFVILEYEVHGKTVRTGASYDNRFIIGRYHRAPQDRAMAGLHGLPGRDGLR